MFEKLEIFRMSHAMATHAGARQAVVAQNMANADTPGYAARDLAPFKTLYETAGRHASAPRDARGSHAGSGCQSGFAPSEREARSAIRTAIPSHWKPRC